MRKTRTEIPALPAAMNFEAYPEYDEGEVREILLRVASHCRDASDYLEMVRVLGLPPLPRPWTLRLQT